MVSIMIDPSFSNSIWCTSMLAGLVAQLKAKRIPFRQIEDFSQLPENCRYIFLVGSDDTWVRSVLKVCNSLGVYPIFLGNEAYHFSEFDYFRIAGIYEQVTKEEILTFIQTVVTPERLCMAVIHPKKEATS